MFVSDCLHFVHPQFAAAAAIAEVAAEVFEGAAGTTLAFVDTEAISALGYASRRVSEATLAAIVITLVAVAIPAVALPELVAVVAAAASVGEQCSGRTVVGQ